MTTPRKKLTGWRWWLCRTLQFLILVPTLLITALSFAVGCGAILVGGLGSILTNQLLGGCCGMRLSFDPVDRVPQSPESP